MARRTVDGTPLNFINTIVGTNPNFSGNISTLKMTKVIKGKNSNGTVTTTTMTTTTTTTTTAPGVSSSKSSRLPDASSISHLMSAAEMGAMRRHRMIRRASGYVMAKKYSRNIQARAAAAVAATGALHTNNHGNSTVSTTGSSNNCHHHNHSHHSHGYGHGNPSLHSLHHEQNDQQQHNGICGCHAPVGEEELINFWKDLSTVAKRNLLRIHRDDYLTTLDDFLLCQNLCCECHENVLAEWDDHERHRSGARSLQDVFGVFPPFLDEEYDYEYDDEDFEEDGGEEGEDVEDLDGEEEEEDDDDDDDEVVLDEELDLDDELLDEELAMKVRERRNQILKVQRLLSEEYLAALDLGEQHEEELLKMIQQQERYIIIREDHTDFIVDLIRCGQLSREVLMRGTLEPSRSNTIVRRQQGDTHVVEEVVDGQHSDAEDDEEDEDDEEGECPGANTPYLAQEYLLEVLSVKFREQLENAYQAALQHSLAVQAELLRDEIAGLESNQKTSQKKKKNKDKKKKKKKEAAAAAQATVKQTNHNNNNTKSDTRPPETVTKKTVTTKESLSSGDEKCHQPDEELQPEDQDDEEDNGDELDREVEEFRLLLEKINSESINRTKKKLTLPPGTFSSTTASITMCMS